MKRATLADCGCWIEGTLITVVDGSARLIDMAVTAGMPRPVFDPNTDHAEAMSDAARHAEDWMNDHIAPEGASFGWVDGDFFLWSEEDWEHV